MIGKKLVRWTLAVAAVLWAFSELVASDESAQ